MRRAASAPWDLATAAVGEALRSGAAPSLERLGVLGQVGSLAALTAALDDDEALAGAAITHTREREGLGFAPGEVVAELLALGRVLERHGLRGRRQALDWVVLLYFERVTAELGDRARRDPLTGVLNHAAFHAHAAGEVARARRYGGRLALVLFDLDRFKETNDRDGHQEGDRLLRAFAATLEDTVRESDVVGRLGGDEFGVVLLGADARAVAAFLDRLHRRLPAGVSASSGTAFASEIKGTSEALFELADRRLYAEKLARAA
ncbi:MAG TPA: GGDEF domain-containing protein [Gaiellaceae bacterium]|nr:GGDEF domain-containing protein [Gaiellaceae bacterium]